MAVVASSSIQRIDTVIKIVTWGWHLYSFLCGVHISTKYGHSFPPACQIDYRTKGSCARISFILNVYSQTIPNLIYLKLIPSAVTTDSGITSLHIHRLRLPPIHDASERWGGPFLTFLCDCCLVCRVSENIFSQIIFISNFVKYCLAEEIPPSWGFLQRTACFYYVGFQEGYELDKWVTYCSIIVASPVVICLALMSFTARSHRPGNLKCRV